MTLYAKIFRKGLAVGKSLGTQGRIEIDEPLSETDLSIVVRDIKRYQRAETVAEKVEDPFLD